jgi:predicted transposase YbfD/YdcC
MAKDILRMFAGLKDYRTGKVQRAIVKHPLSGLLIILLLSRIAGCRGWDASADWAAAHYGLLRRYLDLHPRPPSADTLRRTAEAYDLADFLDGIVADDAVVHVDGKRACGATLGGEVHHFIEALCGGTVIGMVEMGAGAEGPAIVDLLKDLKLAGKMVTIDAAGTTPTVAATITDGQGDFLLAVEANQPTLLAAIAAAFDAHPGPAQTVKDHGHGRHETRRARTIADPKIVGPVAAAARIRDIRCLCRIERTRITTDGIVTTIHYHISSRRLTPRQYARRVRSHWRIEAMHHVVDGALDEDACRITHAAGVMAALRRLAYAVIAELRGPLSFTRFAQIIHANPALLLDLCLA